MDVFLNQIQESWKIRLGLSTLSGVLAVVSWPPSTFNSLLLFCFTPVILAFFLSPSIKNAFLNIFVCLFLFHSISMSWFSSITDQPLAWALIYIAYFLIPFGQTLPWLLSFWIQRKRGWKTAFISLPIFCLSYETLHFYWDLSYTWMNMGLGFSESPYFLRMYPYIGQEGGGTYIYLVNLLLASIFFAKNSRSKISCLIASVGIISMPSMIKNNQRATVHDTVKIGVFQPKMDPFQIYTNETIDSNFNILRTAIENNLKEEIDLLACPEGFFRNYHDNPIIFNDPHKHSVIKKLVEISEEKGFGIITGVIVIQLYFTNEAPTVSALRKKEGLYYDTYNAAMLIEPNGNIQLRPKGRLVAFTERVPFLEVFKFLESLHLDFTQAAGSYNYKRDTKPFVFRNMTIAPLICYESLYPSVTNDLIQKKANIIMEFSNENWTGTTNKGQRQHESYAKVNTSQFGKQYLRSTFNMGSSLYSKNGTEIIRNTEDELFIVEAGLINGKTFYSKTRKYWLLNVLITTGIVVINFLKS